VVSKEIFAALDAWLFALLLRWARRRHPNKGAAWLGREEATPSAPIWMGVAPSTSTAVRGSARFVIWEPAFDTTCASHTDGYTEQRRPAAMVPTSRMGRAGLGVGTGTGAGVADGHTGGA
jgi:hypothetical protein